MRKAVSPRLFVICAREADVAVIIRRGPSAWAHVIKWDMAHDTFDHGAWIRGRIYAEKCDLSPDGALFLYFVHDGKRWSTTYTSAWSGVSRLPWLSALGLWPNGSTYGGGGRFVGDRHIVLRFGSQVAAHAGHPGKGLKVDFGNAGLHASTGEVEGAQWSGRDRHGALIYAKDGMLYRRSAKQKNAMLADFNGMTPDPQPAPDWATRPLKR